MPTRPFLPGFGFLLLVSFILLSSCRIPSDSIGVTPGDTSPSTLIVTINILEDQDAADQQSTLQFWFQTDIIKESNYVIFDADEHVNCNGMLLTLTDTPMYTLKVPRMGYSCFYFGKSQGSGPPPSVPMIDVAARSILLPQRPVIDPKGYQIAYTADSSDLACPITADAVADFSTINGPASSSQSGIYYGPATDTLTGSGEIILKRTCFWTLHNAFDTIYVTYQSTASVAVTWGQ